MIFTSKQTGTKHNEKMIISINGFPFWFAIDFFKSIFLLVYSKKNFLQTSGFSSLQISIFFFNLKILDLRLNFLCLIPFRKKKWNLSKNGFDREWNQLKEPRKGNNKIICFLLLLLLHSPPSPIAPERISRQNFKFILREITIKNKWQYALEIISNFEFEFWIRIRIHLFHYHFEYIWHSARDSFQFEHNKQLSFKFQPFQFQLAIGVRLSVRAGE